MRLHRCETECWIRLEQESVLPVLWDRISLLIFEIIPAVSITLLVQSNICVYCPIINRPWTVYLQYCVKETRYRKNMEFFVIPVSAPESRCVLRTTLFNFLAGVDMNVSNLVLRRSSLYVPQLLNITNLYFGRLRI